MSPKLFWQDLKATARSWNADNAPRLGAALAYYAVFSLAPVLLLAIAIAGHVFGEQASRGEVLDRTKDTVGPTAARAIEDLLKSAASAGTGVTATLVGVVLLLFGASGFFIELQDAFNLIWKVKPRPGLGLLALLRNRLLSFVLVLGMGFLLLASLAAGGSLVVIGNYMKPVAEALPGGIWAWHALVAVISFALIVVVLATIYKILPDTAVPWRAAWVGAMIAALLFAVGRLGIGLYLGETSVTTPFGAAGSVIVILVWVYYSTQILIFGAEWSRVWANRN